MGDVKTDASHFKQILPTYNAARLQRPYFIAHGAQDTTVDIEHAYRMRLMLEKHEHPFEWYVDPDADHSLGTPSQQAVFFERILRCLHKHL